MKMMLWILSSQRRCTRWWTMPSRTRCASTRTRRRQQERVYHAVVLDAPNGVLKQPAELISVTDRCWLYLKLAALLNAFHLVLREAQGAGGCRCQGLRCGRRTSWLCRWRWG